MRNLLNHISQIKKDKKSNPNFTRMKTEHLSSLEDFLKQRIKQKGEINHNGVVGLNLIVIQFIKRIKQ